MSLIGYDKPFYDPIFGVRGVPGLGRVPYHINSTLVGIYDSTMNVLEVQARDQRLMQCFKKPEVLT